MSQDSKNISELQKKYLEHVRTVYPGLRCFSSIQRNDRGETIILIHDETISTDSPAYVVSIGSRDLTLIALGQGMTIPAMTYQDFERLLASGETPDGYIKANYP